MKERIKQVRIDTGLSMQKFGDRIGISSPSVARLESGQNNPSEQTIRAICREFNVSRAWLETGAGPAYLETQNLEEQIDVRLASASPIARATIKTFLLKCTDEELLQFEKLAEKLVAAYQEEKNKTPE